MGLLIIRNLSLHSCIFDSTAKARQAPSRHRRQAPCRAKNDHPENDPDDATLELEWHLQDMDTTVTVI